MVGRAQASANESPQGNPKAELALKRPAHQREKGLWNFLTWSFFLSQIVAAQHLTSSSAQAAEAAGDDTRVDTALDAAGGPPGALAALAFLDPADLQQALALAAQSIDAGHVAAGSTDGFLVLDSETAEAGDAGAKAGVRTVVLDEPSLLQESSSPAAGGDSPGSSPDIPGSILDPVIPPIVDVVVDILDPVLDPMMDVVGDVAGALEPVVEGVVAPLAELAGGLVNALEPVVDGVAAPVAALAGGLVDALEPVVDGVAAPVVALAGGLVGALEPVVDGVLGPIASTVADVTAPVGGSVDALFGSLIGEGTDPAPGGSIADALSALGLVSGGPSSVIEAVVGAGGGLLGAGGLDDLFSGGGYTEYNLALQAGASGSTGGAAASTGAALDTPGIDLDLGALVQLGSDENEPEAGGLDLGAILGGGGPRLEWHWL